MKDEKLTNNQQPTTNNYFKPKGLATAIGSLPHTNPKQAVRIMLNNFNDMPAWPQLSKRSFKENMYIQYSEGLPSVNIDESNEKIFFDTKNISELEGFYQKFLERDLNYFKISKDYAAGLHSFIKEVTNLREKPQVIKGQVTGPISFGLTVKDQDNKSIIFNEQFADVVVKGLGLKAAWQEFVFKKIAPNSQAVIFFDEPYLVSLGSAFTAINEQDVLEKLDECFSFVEGLAGIHVCGGTDWGLIMRTKVDLIHFDAYNYFESLTLYPDQLSKFLNRGGILGWGITPHTAKIEAETAQSIFEQFKQKIDRIISIGIDEKMLIEQSLVAPSCGAGSLSRVSAEKALSLTKEVSKLFQRHFFD